MEKNYPYTCCGKACTIDADTLAELFDLGVECAEGDWLYFVSPHNGDAQDTEVSYDSMGELLVSGMTLDFSCIDGAEREVSLSAVLDSFRECISGWNDEQDTIPDFITAEDMASILYFVIYQELP